MTFSFIWLFDYILLPSRQYLVKILKIGLNPKILALLLSFSGKGYRTHGSLLLTNSANLSKYLSAMTIVLLIVGMLATSNQISRSSFLRAQALSPSNSQFY
jgi:hypothetical protein